jgi:hypothetical protein
MSLQRQLDALAIKHRAEGILLDTNVLLLFIFAGFMPEKIVASKRLAKYDGESGHLLLQFVAQFDKILTTEHVLAETSNLARQVVSGAKWNRLAAQLYPLFCLMDRPEFEVLDVDNSRVDLELFSQLGLTDGVIAANLGTGLLLTDDLDLFLAATRHQCDAINFTHMREAAGLL